MDAASELLAIEQIKQLKARYFRCMDTKDWPGLRAVFCDDAEFDARQSLSPDGSGGSEDWVYQGGDQIARFIQETVTPLRTVHHGHCHEIAIHSESEASGVIAMEDRIWDQASGAQTLWGYGHYHETYRREPEGWRILKSKLTRLQVMPQA